MPTTEGEDAPSKQKLKNMRITVDNAIVEDELDIDIGLVLFVGNYFGSISITDSVD